MKVNIRVHLCLRGVPTIIGPLKLGTPLSGDNIHDLVLDQVRELLTADEFSDDLRRNHYLVSAKRVGERSLESDQEEWYDVYCVRAAAQSSTAGITKNELLSELREVFGLSEVKEEAVIPWKAPRVDQNEGGTRTLAENDTGVEDHSVQSGKLKSSHYISGRFLASFLGLQPPPSSLCICGHTLNVLDLYGTIMFTF